jgi:hypothetical protein
MERRQNFQNVAWFHDLRMRGLLNLDPPYQRRSVWSQRFKDYFVDTVLLNYPAPAIFLYEEMSPEGRSVYQVVDGKQRLTSLFEFIDGAFPVSDKTSFDGLKGQYFKRFNDDDKRRFWSYQFLVEYIPKDDEKLIDDIFERINRNVAKLTPQELRHAKYDGAFISAAERLALWMAETIGDDFPRLASQSRSQMKDVELVALLLLLTEAGPQNYSQADLDAAFSSRDDEWEKATEVENIFQQTIRSIKDILDVKDVLKLPFATLDLRGSRLRNQTDFYSLYGAMSELKQNNLMPAIFDCSKRLIRFLEVLENPNATTKAGDFKNYVDAARSASNDKGARETRIQVMKKALLKELLI